MPSVRSRLVAATISFACRMLIGPFSAVSWCTITSGSALATASATDSGSSASRTTGSAPSARSASALAAERVVPTTSWPRATSWTTNWLPIAPDAPARKIFMTSPFVELTDKDEMPGRA